MDETDKDGVAARRKPGWLFPRRGGIADGHGVRRLLRRLDLETVCESARCPNRGECFSGGTATFLVLGDVCTRRCGFCAVPAGAPGPVRPGEAAAVAEAVAELGLNFVVVTSVTRDDLADGGASHFAAVIRAVATRRPAAKVEVLIPDFGGRPESLDLVLDAAPAVLNHNLETVPRLYPRVRPGADYGRSLDLLRRARRHGAAPVVKSGLMLGLGEEPGEAEAVMRDLASAGCRCLTLGQYLPPARGSLPVARYLRPEEFDELAASGRRLGIELVLAGPMVRSSYRAAEAWGALAAAAPAAGGVDSGRRFT